MTTRARYNFPLRLLEVIDLRDREGTPEEREAAKKATEIENGKVVIRGRNIGDIILKAAEEVENRGLVIRSTSIGDGEVIVVAYPPTTKRPDPKAYSRKKIRG
jgi:hypothetical protein